MNEIHAHLKDKKPNLSLKSIDNYVSNLRRLGQRVFGSEYDVDSFYDKLYTRKGSKQVLEWLNQNVSNVSTRKTHLAALVSACPEKTEEQKRCCQMYRLHMIDNIEDYNDEIKTQQKSDKQRKSWKSWEEILKIYTEYGKSVQYLWGKSSLTTQEYKRLQQFVLASLYVLISPRRIQDYQHLRFTKDEDENYIQGKTLVFNKFKTSRNYGSQKVKIPSSLQTILKKWRLRNKDKTYVITSQESDVPLTQPTLTMMLQKVFGSGISVNMLRHIYISDVVLKDVPDLSELEQKAENMGHSLGQQMLYKKI